MRILIRATNWLGDAVMSLPAIRAVRANYRTSEITLLAKRSVADLYARESSVDKVIIYSNDRWRTSSVLRKHRFHLGILLTNSFDSALVMQLARIPQIVGYDTDMRRLLLTHPVKVPGWKNSTHERFYYLELLQAAHIIDAYHQADVPIRLECTDAAAITGREAFSQRGFTLPIIGVSPGAAYGGAKCWYPERFAESAGSLATRYGGTVALFGATGDMDACQSVERLLQGHNVPVVNLAGRTTLREFIDLAAACFVFLTNDSGAMHVASALSVPTVAIFGATNPATTGPAGSIKTVVREQVKCGPCFKRECPIDHRCMERISADRVLKAAETLIQPAKARS